MSTVIDGSASVTINNGAVLGITRGTAVASTSGTSIDFTSIPSWIKRITVMFNGVSTNSTSVIVVRLGTSGGIVATSYIGASGGFLSVGQGVAAYSTGFALESDTAAARIYSGNMVINNMSGNTWTEFHALGLSTTEGGGARVCNGGGYQELSGTLTQLRITTVGGTATFDAGTINILYEG